MVMPSESDPGLAIMRERQSLETGRIVAIAIGTAAALAICMEGLWLFYAAQGKPEQKTAETVFPGPALQSHPVGDLRAMKAAQAKQLNSYAWVDRQHGIVQVPIERAMQLVVARGAKAYDPPIGGTP
jgi:hypothetical protein